MALRLSDLPGEERRNRILSHMNRCHTRELSHYLRYYVSTSRRDTANPSLRDVTLQGMRIRARGTDHTIPFTPPLESWDELKPRIIEMDVVARRHLGISDVFLDTYTWPTERPERAAAAGVLFYFACYAALPWLVPGSAGWGVADAVFPGGAAWFRWIVRTIFYPVIGIHVLEAALLDRKLRKYGVDRGTGLWWKWTLSCLVEGFGAFRRIDAIVGEKRAQKRSKAGGKA